MGGPIPEQVSLGYIRKVAEQLEEASQKPAFLRFLLQAPALTSCRGLSMIDCNL